MQYESPISSGSKVTAKVKVFQKEVKLPRSQGQNLWYHVKGLVKRNTRERSCHKEYTCNMKALPLLV